MTKQADQKEKNRRLVCDRIMIEVSECLPELRYAALQSTMRAELYKDIAGRMVLTLNASMPGILKERIVVHKRWPADWWEAMKSRWAPLWFVKRWPVKWEEISIDKPIYAAVCPHVKCDSQGSHLEWLFINQEGK